MPARTRAAPTTTATRSGWAWDCTGHDRQDIDLFAKELGFDFIKVDFCGGTRHGLPERERYTAIHKAILNTGRTDVRLNVCRWAYPGTWVNGVAASWRTTEDIYLGWNSLLSIIGQNLYLSAYATEGKFNDMDMLEVGRGMFNRVDLGECVGSMEVEVPMHGTRIYTLEAEKRYERSKHEAETAWLNAYQELENNQTAETGIYEEADHCSGGAKAGWLGKSKENYLEWRNVYSEEGGTCTGNGKKPLNL